MDQEKSAYPEDSEVFSTAATFAGLGPVGVERHELPRAQEEAVTYKP